MENSNSTKIMLDLKVTADTVPRDQEKCAPLEIFSLSKLGCTIIVIHEPPFQRGDYLC